MGGMVPLGDTIGTCAGPEQTPNVAESIKWHRQHLDMHECVRGGVYVCFHLLCTESGHRPCVQ